MFAASFHPSTVSAQTQGGAATSCFLGLNDSSTPAAIPSCESPDLLNTESDLGGTAILKRKGYSLFADLTYSTAPVNGSHSFIDSSGNRLDIVCQDRNCAKSTNGNAFATFLTTAAAGITRWSFVDVGGVLYGANNKYDKIMRYNGTTRTSAVDIPLGSILEMTQDRMVVGDISGSPNRVHHSSAGAFENFTLGVNPEDSFFDDVGAAGDKVRGLKYSRGNLYIFKTASVTSCELADQYNTRCAVILPNLGTTDPASIITAGDSLYFRGQDKNYWEISSQGVRSISAKIPNLVKSQSGGLGGGENSNTQTTQADWENGAESPTNSWDTVTIPGSIFPSSSTLRDATTANFALGTCSGCGVSPNGYVQFAGVTSTHVLRYDADVLPTDDGWARVGVGTSLSESVSAGTFTVIAGIDNGPTFHKYFTTNSVTNTQMTVRMATTNQEGDASVAVRAGNTTVASIRVEKTSTTYIGIDSSDVVELLDQTIFSTYTIIVSTSSGGSSVAFWRNGVFKTSAVLTGNNNIDHARMQCAGSLSATQTCYFNFLHISTGAISPGTADIVSVATFTSRIFDTAVTTPTFGPIAITSYPVTGATISYSVRTSTSGNDDLWGSYESVNNASRPTLYTNRYVQYRSTFTQLNLVASPGITRAELPFATTGQFVSQCIQPNSSISTWGTLSCAQTLISGGSQVFFATSAATCAALPTADPTPWATTETNNATLTVATNTAVKYAWRSLMGSSTDQAQVDACTLAWNEGTAVQPAWAVYDSIKNAVYWTTTINSASSANRLLKYDRNIEQWFPFDLKAQAPKMITNKLYFGGASSGTWNLYGDVDADIGGAINAYWKGKDIGSDYPFNEKGFKTISILSRNQQAGNMTATWTLSNGRTGDYTISLSTGAGINYARSNFNIPSTSPQQFLNVKVGNNSSTPFEVLGIGVTWDVKPWRVSGP